MSTTNNFTIIGRLGKDVETKTYENSTKGTFGIAVSETDKENNKTTAWLNFTAWRKGEGIKEFDVLKKGQLVQVQGWFKPETYNGKSYITFMAQKWEPVAKKEEQKEAE